MSQLTTRRQYAASQPLLKSDLDAFIDDIETFINVIGLGNDNLQTASITASTVIIDNTLPNSKFANGAFTTAKIADSNVTTAKLADSSVTTAKVDALAVTTAKIADSAVTTAKIADGILPFTHFVSEGMTSGSLASGSIPSFYDNLEFTKALELTITTTASDAYVIIEGTGGYFTATGTNIDATGTITSDSIGTTVVVSRKASGATDSTFIGYFIQNDNCRPAPTALTYATSMHSSYIKFIVPASGAGTYVYGIFYSSSYINPVTATDLAFTIRKLSK